MNTGRRRHPQGFTKGRLRTIGGCFVVGWLLVLSLCLPPIHRMPLRLPSLLNIAFVQPASAQRFSLDGIWQQVYEQLPDLPKENHYINRDTGEPAETNTLVGRFIRYHLYVQGRPPTYRLDWKLTMADYLGANEFIVPATYPSADTLSQNPAEGDQATIRSLNRAQRDALIQAIVDIVSTGFAPSSPAPTPESPAAPPDAVPATPSPLREPQPGDAQLLLP